MSKYLKFILLVLFTILIFWFFGRDLDWQEVRRSLSQADPFYLTAAVLVICLGYLLRAIRWKVLLSPITDSSLKELFATTTVGFAAIFFVGRAGEIVRPMWLPMRDRRVRPSAALVTLGLERIFDLAAIICFFAVNLLFFSAPPGRESEFYYIELAGYLMLGGIVAGFAVMAVYHRVSHRVIDWTARFTDKRWFPKRIRRIILSILRQLSAALGILKDWRELLSVSFWTFTLWLAIAVPTWLALIAFDMPITFSDSLFIMGFAVVGSLVPTPGGAAGAFHTATAAGLLFIKGDMRFEDAAAVSIAMHLIYFAPAVIFGLYYFFHGDISIERFKSLLSDDRAIDEAVDEIESDSPHITARPVP